LAVPAKTVELADLGGAELDVRKNPPHQASELLIVAVESVELLGLGWAELDV
jgi:hypothetical protein